MKYQILQLEDYNKKIKINGETYYGYSEKELENHYPENDYTVIGELKRNGKKKKIGELVTGEIISRLDSHSRIFNRKEGYLCVGQDRYIVILRFRLLLFLLFLLGVLLIGVTLLVTRLAPESDIEPIENDTTIKKEIKEGDGSVTMVWTLDAEVDLSKRKVDVYFQNPNASTHDVEVELYIVSGDKEVLIARSGRVKAGYALNSMDLRNATRLAEGSYKGVYRITGYDPATGEEAAYMPEIPNVLVKVHK